MHHFPRSLRLRLRHAWQRLTRGYGDDEIDWEARAKIEAEVKQEMEEKFGAELALVRAYRDRVLACEEIMRSKHLSREQKIAGIEEQFPGDDEDAIADRARYLDDIDRR